MSLDIDQAACITTDPEVFFPDPSDLRGIATARSYCKRCPVSAECLQASLDLDARYGIWGGLTPEERGYRERHARPGPPRSATCPSHSAYKRHLADGDPPCDQCRTFVASYNRDYYHRTRGAS